MLGFLKKFMRKTAEAPAESADQPAQEYSDDSNGYQEAEPANVPPPEPIRRTQASQFRQAASPVNGRAAQSNQSNGVQSSGKGVELPLQTVLSALPLELQPRVLHAEVGETVITVPLEKILSQLARGVVKLSFGELRNAAAGVFSAENDRDRVLVTLPLNEILARVNPGLITRRRAQRRIEVPADIRSPFDARGEGVSFSLTPAKPAPAAPAPAPAPAPAQLRTPPPAPAPAALPMSSKHFTPFTATPKAPAPTPPAAPAVPFAPRSPVNPNPAPEAPTFVRRQTQPAQPSQPAPLSFSNPVQGRGNSVSAQVPQSPFTPPAPAIVNTPRPPVELKMAGQPPSAPAPAPAQARPIQKASGETLPLSLTAMAESWPESIRQEIVNFSLVDATIQLPVEAVEQGLKQGRLVFSWKNIRAWTNSRSAASPSAEDETNLELPLKTVAPLFMARQKNGKSQQKISVDKEIPNLFFGFPQADGAPAPAESQPQAQAQPQAPAPESHAVSKPADTNYYTFGDQSDTAQINASEGRQHAPSPGTKFLSRYATPNEVVGRAAALDGIAGALIALPDGLMVASRLSPDLNGDTLAAFLPQIFGKVSSCTKELRMGDLNNLNFTVGNVPWKIFRVNAIFFAAFGKVGEPLPSAQLAALAAELDHKPK